MFAARGVSVAVVGRRQGLLDEIATEIESAGADALAIAVDLAEPDAAERIVTATLDRFDRLDILVNNAAVIAHKLVGEFSLEEFDHHIAVNLRSPFRLIEVALPALRSAPAGMIVNVSSAAAIMYRPGQALYAMTKTALEHLTRSLAVELGPAGIRVNCVRPGPTKTPIHVQYTDDVEARHAALSSMVPLGRMGEADEVARWIVELSDPEASSWVTGAVVSVDGGRTLGSPSYP